MQLGEKQQLPPILEETLLSRFEKGELELPLLPRSTAQILAASEEELGGLLSNVLGRDLSLAASVLQMANTPLYRGTSPIVSIPQAMNRLGTKIIRSLIMTMSWNSKGFQVGEYAAEVKQLFAHSLGVALCSQEVARRLRKNVEEAFLVGLLHDIGRPILLQAVCTVAKELKLHASRGAVLDMIVMRHPEIGALLVQRWTLPVRFQRIIAAHHEAEPCAEDRAGVHLLQLGDVLAKHMLEELPVEVVQNHDAVVSLNIYPDMLEGILQKRDTIKEAVQQFISTCA